MAKTPSVGRTVHYVAYGTPGGEYRAGAHRAAIVAEVYSGPDGRVDPENVALAVINPTGLFFNTNVPYDGSDAPRPGTWHWPEYVPEG